MADEYAHAYSALKQSSLRGVAGARRGDPCAAETPDSQEARRRILQREHAAQRDQAHADAAGLQICPTEGMQSCPRAELAQQHPVFSLPRSAGPRVPQPGCDVRAQSTADPEEHGACPVRSCKRCPSFASLCVPWLTSLSASSRRTRSRKQPGAREESRRACQARPKATDLSQQRAPKARCECLAPIHRLAPARQR